MSAWPSSHTKVIRMREKICPICGKTFCTRSDYPDQKTCSQECAAVLRKQTKQEKANTTPSPLIDDLAGKTFGDLTCVEYLRDRRAWLCQCACGRTTVIRGAELKSGARTDCGHTAWANAKARLKSGAAGHVNGTQINTIRHVMDGKLRANNSSGATGVRERHNSSNIYYTANIMVKGKSIYLGSFLEFSDAVKARKDAERRYFGPLIRDAEKSTDEGGEEE